MTYQVTCIAANGTDMVVWVPDARTDEAACKEALALLAVTKPGMGWQAFCALPYEGWNLNG